MWMKGMPESILDRQGHEDPGEPAKPEGPERPEGPEVAGPDKPTLEYACENKPMGPSKASVGGPKLAVLTTDGTTAQSVAVSDPKDCVHKEPDGAAEPPTHKTRKDQGGSQSADGHKSRG